MERGGVWAEPGNRKRIAVEGALWAGPEFHIDPNAKSY
jgi:hypothetical protein